MGNGNSHTTFGDLSKPAIVLIEKISDATGGIFRPYQIKRVAKAEAAKLRALADLEISDIQQRALVRLVHEEGKKQENIERITTQSIKELTQDVKPEKIADDWIAHFFDKCRLVSDAHLFTNLCSFAWNIGRARPLIYNLQNEIYAKRGITFSSLNHLSEIGLISFNSLTGYMSQGLPRTVATSYYETPVVVEFKMEKDNNFNLGNVLLSKVGQELAPISGSQPLPGFLEYVLGIWKGYGYVARTLSDNQR